MQRCLCYTGAGRDRIAWHGTLSGRGGSRIHVQLLLALDGKVQMTAQDRQHLGRERTWIGIGCRVRLRCRFIHVLFMMGDVQGEELLIEGCPGFATQIGKSQHLAWQGIRVQRNAFTPSFRRPHSLFDVTLRGHFVIPSNFVKSQSYIPEKI